MTEDRGLRLEAQVAVVLNFSFLARARLIAGEAIRKGTAMKVRASVKRMCNNCKIIHRKGVVRVICVNPKHKQRQG